MHVVGYHKLASFITFVYTHPTTCNWEGKDGEDFNWKRKKHKLVYKTKAFKTTTISSSTITKHNS